MTWSEALSRLELDEQERHELREYLRMSIAAVRPERGACSELSATSEIAHALRLHSADGAAVPEHGYLWKGRAGWLDAATLERLQAEATAARPRAALATKHLLLEGEPAAAALLQAPAFSRFVAEATGTQERYLPSSTYYHWYEAADHRVEPHLDTSEFSLSLLVLLGHQRTPDGDHRSAFFLWPPGSGPCEITLEVGEGILFHSGAVVHARSAPGPGEAVTTVSFGLQHVGKGGLS